MSKNMEVLEEVPLTPLYQSFNNFLNDILEKHRMYGVPGYFCHQL